MNSEEINTPKGLAMAKKAAHRGASLNMSNEVYISGGNSPAMASPTEKLIDAMFNRISDMMHQTELNNNMLYEIIDARLGITVGVDPDQNLREGIGKGEEASASMEGLKVSANALCLKINISARHIQTIIDRL